MSAVKFHTVDVNINLNKKTKLKEFLKYIFSSEEKELDKVEFIFCNDDFLLSLNQQFLQHDYYTDILTFNLSKSDKAITGEIYISIDRVRENAAFQSSSYFVELRRVIFHGVLHLCNYSDKLKRDKTLMTKKENQYLEQFETFHVETNKHSTRK